MRHVDSDTLALLALGETVDNDGMITTHLFECPHARAELERPAHPVGLGPRCPRGPRGDAAACTGGTPSRRAGAGPQGQTSTDVRPSGEVVDLGMARERRARRWDRRRLFAVTAAVVLVVVAVGGIALLRRDSGSSRPSRRSR